jgi:putative DNA primase/helicase
MEVKHIPSDLREYNQWCVWRFDEVNGKHSKVPYSPLTGRRASTTNPSEWGTFEAAVSLMEQAGFDGIGFLFTVNDPFAGLDIDDCLDPNTGHFVNEQAEKIVRRLDSYTEISPSGNGVKIWVKATKQHKRNRKKLGDLTYEFYDCGRYFTVTGRIYGGNVSLSDYGTIQERDEEYNTIHGEIFAPPPAKSENPLRSLDLKGNTDEGVTSDGGDPQDACIGNLTDDQILNLLWQFPNADKTMPLMYGNISDFGNDDSVADMALCCRLAYVCGPNPEQIFRLVLRSGLMREKWNRDDYREATIGKAIEFVAERGFYPGNIWTYTEDDTARQLVERYGDDFRWCEAMNKFLVYDSGAWETGSKLSIMPMAKDTARAIYAAAKRIKDGDLRQKVVNWAKTVRSRNGLESMVSLARTEPGITIRPEQLDADPWLLNVANGTLDLRNGDLREHRRGDYLTHSLAVSYDRMATCPTWEWFLAWAVPDSDTRTFLHRMVGYTLTGVVHEHVLPMLYGEGRNGKSTFTRVLESLLGTLAIKARADTLMAGRFGPRQGATPEIVRLRSKRLVTVSEIEEGHRLNEALIKDLTGGDAITARNLYESEITFLPTHKIWMYGNYKPTIRGTDTGIWRRLKLVPFAQTLQAEDVDPSLPDKLAAELPGILAWAVRGCLEWQEKGLGSPAVIKEATEDYRNEGDTISRFIEAECECEETPELVGSSELYNAYRAWCKLMAEYPFTHRRFSMELKKRGVKDDRLSSGHSAFKGIRLKPDNVLKTALNKMANG